MMFSGRCVGIWRVICFEYLRIQVCPKSPGFPGSIPSLWRVQLFNHHPTDVIHKSLIRIRMQTQIHTTTQPKYVIICLVIYTQPDSASLPSNSTGLDITDRIPPVTRF